MPLGTFNVTINGDQLGEFVEKTAKIRVQFAGTGNTVRSWIKDSDADKFVFPHRTNEERGSVALPHTLTLKTDVTSGVSTAIGYLVTVTTEYGGVVTVGPFGARPTGSTVALVDLASDFEGQVAESIATRAETAAAEAKTARDQTVAVGNTNDTIIAGRVNDPASATTAALANTTEVVAAAPSGGDDRTPLNTLLAANAGKVVRLQRGATYTVSDQLAIATGTTLEGNGATITQTGLNKVSLDITGSNVTLRNLRLVGKATDYVSGGAVQAVGINIGAASAVRLEGLRLTGHAGAGVKIVNSADVTVDRCTIVGTSPAAGDGTQMGVYVDTSAARVNVSNCDISATAQGVISGVSVTDLRVVNNNIYNITGQHGLYIQSGTRTVITGNAIRNCGLNGIKFQLQTSATADSYGLAVSNNVVDTTGDQGIILTTTDDAVARRFYDATIVGNVVRGAASTGIYLDAVSRANVIGNIVDDADLHGLFVTRATDLTVSSNLFENIARVGIFLNTGAERVHMRDNRINNPAGANFASTQYGIYILAGSDHLLDGNQITADNGLMVYGVFFGAGDQATSTWRNNRVSGANAYGARLIAATAVRAWADNDLSGTTGRVLNPPATGAGMRAREEFGSAAPTTGAYVVGDRVWNVAPAAGGTIGWVCTTAGSPGTWKTFGSIAA